MRCLGAVCLAFLFGHAPSPAKTAQQLFSARFRPRLGGQLSFRFPTRFHKYFSYMYIYKYTYIAVLSVFVRVLTESPLRKFYDTAMNVFETTEGFPSPQDPPSDEHPESTESEGQESTTRRSQKRRRITNTRGKKGVEKCADCRRLKKKVTLYTLELGSHSDLVRLCEQNGRL